MSSADDAGSRRRKRALADAVAGVVGSLVSLWTFYPIEVWKTNLQAGSSVPIFGNSDINSRSEVSSLFQGCRSKTLHTASSNFCYFFLFSWIVSHYRKQRRSGNSHKIHPSTRLLLSAVAAMLNTMITLPLDVISSKHVTMGRNDDSVQGKDNENVEIEEKMDQVWEDLQLHDSESDCNSLGEDAAEFQECFTDPSNDLNEAKNMTLGSSEDSNENTSLEVTEASPENWASLWKGLTPALLLCSNPSINYTAFDIAKNHILMSKSNSRKASASLSMPEAFVVGLFAKFIATVATYPLIRAKVILMVTSETSLWSALVRSYEQHGVRGLYKGCDWQLLHTVLKSALMMMVREKITASTHQLIVGTPESPTTEGQ